MIGPAARMGALRKRYERAGRERRDRLLRVEGDGAAMRTARERMAVLAEKLLPAAASGIEEEVKDR